ncbi:MAG TPA: TonB-dependent receptor, partial [Ignavibacteria bacterium]|nr:TonB-dependent receptor [Ignavibacteria bacterium]
MKNVSLIMKIFHITKHVAGYILLFTILTVINTFAGNTGKIAGKIIDKSNNRPLIGANILIMGTTMGAATGVNGEYYILDIPPGTYEIKASLIGYQSVIVKNVNVSADQTTRLDFKLGIQAVQLKSIVVIASTPIVQKDLTSTQQNISGKNIKMLPVENVQSVINLQAGVVNGHFRGGRLGEVKYMIDGVAVNDVYSGKQTMEANLNSIQELQVITGTFNAEYGQALSGVVNEITKIPNNHYSGSFSTYAGDYVTGRTSLYSYMGGMHPLRTHDIQGTLSGPIPLTNGFVKFFSSAKYLSNNGYLYGKRIFDPQDSSNFNANNPKDWYIGATGNGADVPMNYSRILTLQGKLDFKVGTGRGIILEGLYQKHDYKDYNYLFRFNPDGDYKNFQNTFLGSISYTHVFSQSAFLDLQTSIYSTDYKQYVYKNPLDPRYVSPIKFRQVGGNALYTAGTQNWHFSHNTKTYTAKISFTDQITNVHELKTGIEFDYYSMDYQDFQVMVLPQNNYKPSLPQSGAFNYNIFHNNPYQFSYYIQDKIELSYLI